MGFFSWTCERCGTSLLSEQAAGTDDKEYWKTRAYVLTPNGSVLVGRYDGYGEVDGRDVGESPQVWHYSCAKLDEKEKGPLKWTHGSPYAPDQGFFLLEEPYVEQEDPWEEEGTA